MVPSYQDNTFLFRPTKCEWIFYNFFFFFLYECHRPIKSIRQNGANNGEKKEEKKRAEEGVCCICERESKRSSSQRLLHHEERGIRITFSAGYSSRHTISSHTDWIFLFVRNRKKIKQNEGEEERQYTHKKKRSKMSPRFCNCIMEVPLVYIVIVISAESCNKRWKNLRRKNGEKKVAAVGSVEWLWNYFGAKKLRR